MRSLFTLCVLVLFLALASPAAANDVQVKNVALTNVSAGSADIQFDLSWSNSWWETWTESGGTVTVTNWDAVWVVAKYRVSGGLWQHAMLSASGHTAQAGTVIDISLQEGAAQGAFVHRAAAGSGPQVCTGMALRWDYAASGLSSTTEVDIAVLATEMVYIPKGAFVLGSGGDEGNRFYRYPETHTPFRVTNESAIVVGSVTGQLSYLGGGDFGSPIPGPFPKGYAPFYCMKHEMSQQQYTDFLNLLDPTVAASYYPNAYGANRYTIAKTGAVYTVDAPHRACNYVNAHKILAWLDWVCLRPMTELEFEKICRGPRDPWIHEFAWGNSSYTLATGITNDGAVAERALPLTANVHFGSGAVPGPLRCGSFAGPATSREQAGASYFGVMEMSGNLAEFTVAVSRSEGRMFDGEHGDGNIYTGLPDSWQPAPGGRAYTQRGYSGAYSGYFYQGRTSDRSSADANNQFSADNPYFGCRGVRRAP